MIKNLLVIAVAFLAITSCKKYDELTLVGTAKPLTVSPERIPIGQLVTLQTGSVMENATRFCMLCIDNMESQILKRVNYVENNNLKQ